ncbi:MAG: hypothetical protein QXE12_00500 [Conexivisphaerales archaeon]
MCTDWSFKGRCIADSCRPSSLLAREGDGLARFSNACVFKCQPGDKGRRRLSRPVEDGASLPSFCHGEDCLEAPEARMVSEVDKPEGSLLLLLFPTV